MAIKTVFANGAGSAGKSTSVTALGTIAAQHGSKVLIIDGDSQATATRSFGINPKDCPRTFGDVLLRKCTAKEAVIATEVEGVSLLPAARDLESVTAQLFATRGAERRLKTALRDIDDQYDLILTDCPGQLSIVTSAALVAADKVVTVSFPTGKESQGITDFELLVRELAEAHDLEIRMDAILICMVPSRNAGALYAEVAEAINEKWPEKVAPKIRRGICVPDSFVMKKPLPIAFPNQGVTADYEAAYNWLHERRIV